MRRILYNKKAPCESGASLCTDRYSLHLYFMTGRIVVAVRLPSTLIKYSERIPIHKNRSYASLFTAIVRRDTFLAAVFLW